MKKHEELFSHRNGYCGCLESEYEKRNETAINKLLNKELTISDCLRELNKSLGKYLVDKSEIKYENTNR